MACNPSQMRQAVLAAQSTSPAFTVSQDNQRRQSLLNYYPAETTRDLSLRMRCHPSHAVHSVSWSDYLNVSQIPNIQQRPLQKGLDAFILSNVLSPAECRSLIHLSERHGYVMLKCTENKPKTTGRTNTRVQIDDTTLAALLYRRMKKFLPKTYRLRDGIWDLCGLNERFRCCKYVKGQHFNGIHYDKWVVLPERNMRSLYTVNIYLNARGQSYGGGRTIFFDEIQSRNGGSSNRHRVQWKETSSVSGNTGDVLIFNHFPQKYRHSGEQLSSGIKYLLRSDVMYKRRVNKVKPFWSMGGDGGRVIRGYEKGQYPRSYACNHDKSRNEDEFPPLSLRSSNRVRGRGRGGDRGGDRNDRCNRMRYEERGQYRTSNQRGSRRGRYRSSRGRGRGNGK